jgi:hypothetical protein
LTQLSSDIVLIPLLKRGGNQQWFPQGYSIEMKIDLAIGNKKRSFGQVPETPFPWVG